MYKCSSDRTANDSRPNLWKIDLTMPSRKNIPAWWNLMTPCYVSIASPSKSIHYLFEVHIGPETQTHSLVAHLLCCEVRHWRWCSKTKCLQLYSSSMVSGRMCRWTQRMKRIVPVGRGDLGGGVRRSSSWVSWGDTCVNVSTLSVIEIRSADSFPCARLSLEAVVVISSLINCSWSFITVLIRRSFGVLPVFVLPNDSNLYSLILLKSIRILSLNRTIDVLDIL